MGVYIKGMEMPTRCIACRLNYDSCACILTGSRFYKYNTEFDPSEEILSDCPLIPVPHHGRCIDADALLTSKSVGTQIAGWGKMYHETCIEYAPTIIPAEESE